MTFARAAVVLAVIGFAAGQITPAQNFLPVSFTVTSAPYDIIATPITPVAPYSQAAYQCNVTGDSRFPPYASGTFPLTLAVPVGQRVRVIFANGNLNGATTTQSGEPGVIVQQGGSPIVQQAGGASPIVQKTSSPVVQQTTASPAALVVQQTPTVVQQPTYPAAPSIPTLPPIVQQPTTPATPATTPKAASPPPPATVASPPPKAASPPPPTAASPPPTVASPPPTTASPPPKASSPPPPAPVVVQSPPTPTVVQSPPTPTVVQSPPTPTIVQSPPTPTVNQGRKLLQDSGLVPGGPNGGLVEYVALSSANTVPGFFAGSTQFGVPYVEFTASAAAAGQTASFRGALVVAQVVNGVPIYPFVPNQSLSPNCQVNVNFNVA